MVWSKVLLTVEDEEGWNFKDIQITEWNVAKGSYRLCHVGFYGVTNVVVKELAQWNNSNKKEAMILQKHCYPNMQMFLGLGLAREWCPRHFKIPQHKQKVCHFRKCRWRKLTKWGKLVGYYISSLWCSEVFASLSWNPPMATIQTIIIVVKHGQNASVLKQIFIAFGKACSIHNAMEMMEERDLSKFPYLAPQIP